MSMFPGSRLLAFLLPVSAFLWVGCNKALEEEELLPEVAFSFDFPALPVTIDSATVAGPGLVLELDSNALAQAMAAQGYLPGQLMGVSINKASLYWSAPAGGSYDPVRSAALQLGAGDAAPVTVASMDPVPVGAQTLLLPLAGAEVLHLLRGNHPRISFRMQFDGAMPQSDHLLVLGARVAVMP